MSASPTGPTDNVAEQLNKAIRAVPDFPVEGVTFRDLTPLLADNALFNTAVDAMLAPFTDVEIDCVAAIEARGFIFAAPMANRLNAAFVPLRKKGKLPWKTHSASYDLEYGTATLEVHQDAFDEHSNVLIVDDILATGGTAAAAIRLVEQAGGTVQGISMLLELVDLGGRDVLSNYKVESILEY